METVAFELSLKGVMALTAARGGLLGRGHSVTDKAAPLGHRGSRTPVRTEHGGARVFIPLT